jgi:hypothetical protein
MLACLFLIGLAGVTEAGERTGWKAGAAKIIITPQQSMWMSGYSARTSPATGTRTDLWAKALVLEDARKTRGVLVTLDLVGIDRELSKEVCDALQSKYGFKRDGIILACSHTHCGPVVGGNLNTMYMLDAEQQQRVKDYAKTLRANIVRVVGEALGRLEPAQLSWGIGRATFAVNRRENPEKDVPALRDMNKLKGPSDHDVPVLAVRDGKGQYKAIVVGYACHATVLNFNEWCGDYPGYAQMALEEAHPAAVALFWAGCGADQNPLPRRSVELARKYGRELADAAEAVLKGSMAPLQASLAQSYTEIDLPFGELPTREKLANDALADNRYIANRAKRLLDEWQTRGSLRAAYPYPVQAWRLGSDLTLVTLGGEVVVEYALRLKRELAAGKTWVMGYANDVMAYIPSLKVLKEGGYEGASSMIYYGQPTVWGPRIEELIVTAVHERVKKLDKE